VCGAEPIAFPANMDCRDVIVQSEAEESVGGSGFDVTVPPVNLPSLLSCSYRLTAYQWGFEGESYGCIFLHKHGCLYWRQYLDSGLRLDGALCVFATTDARGRVCTTLSTQRIYKT
jgi:hypothetical protein